MSEPASSPDRAAARPMSRAEFMLTAGGLGHAPVASGTFGSLPGPAAAMLLFGLTLLVGRPDLAPIVINGGLVLLGLAFARACVVHGPWAESRWGRKDPGQVVADEVAGQALTLLGLPWIAAATLDALWHNAVIAGTGFFFFRLFDVIKPPPARGLERHPGGWGVLLDDLAAGVYALIATQVCVRWLIMPLFAG
ncbi:MAG: phosphatidylglycerophosphatase A [Phycisphaerales bacterium]